MTFRRYVLPLFLLACQSPTAFTPPGAVPFDPPAIYRTWWAEVEACSGLRGDFDAVRWYRVDPPNEVRLPTGRPVRGFWASNGNRIFIRAADLDLPYVPRHEMLHALLRRPGHPAEYFVTRCDLGVN